MDYNEPFSGGVERTFHNMIRMCDKHKNHVWPCSMATRNTLPTNTKKIKAPKGVYDLAIIEENGNVLKHLNTILKVAKKVIIKSQHVTHELVDRWSKNHFNYFVYKLPSSSIRTANNKNVFHVVTPYKDTSFWNVIKPQPIEGTMLFIGRVAKQKGIIRLVENFQTFKSKRNLRLKIIGSSNCLSEVKQLERVVAGVKGIDWKNKFLIDNEIKAELQNAEVVVVPSEKETFGQQIAEALLCKVPVFTSFTNKKYLGPAWHSPYTTSFNNIKGLLKAVDNKEFSSPVKFRDEICQKIGLQENKKSFLNILEGIGGL